MKGLKLVYSKSSGSAAAVTTASLVNVRTPVQLEEGPALALTTGTGVSYNRLESVLRYLARSAPALNLYGNSPLQKTEVDHWLQFSTRQLSGVKPALDDLDLALGPVTFLVGHSLTLADIVVWAALRDNGSFQKLLAEGKAPSHVTRYYGFMSAQPSLVKAQELVPAAQPIKTPEKSKEASAKKTPREEGKFIELPGAEMGKVIVRFPPEASGYLHVGHAKAALLNQFYQQNFQGKLILRFDDTNPEKENEHFEQVILKDVELLGIKPDIFTRTSDHFGKIMDLCEQMIRKGKAYCDDTDGELMKKQREERVESANRNNSVEKNLSMWEEMKRGSEAGLKCGVRAKIDMKSDNGCMRDPVIYRCKTEPHVVTGTKYKAYPTYDFACPIVDSVEGVTHSLRTTEYHDRDPQYYWFIEALGLRKPYIWEYSRLNLQNTVMSKRKLTWIVNEGYVEGWDDPRFPTVRGVLRRGMTVEGLKEFVVAQGSSRSVNMMGWDKIWAFNKKVIDPIAPRYTVIPKDRAVVVKVPGVTEHSSEAPVHPKDAGLGKKTVWYSDRIYIDPADAECLTEGEKVTFINWGNLLIKKIARSSRGVEEILASLLLSDTDYKKTQKLTWLAEVKAAEFTPTVCVMFDNIISKAILDKDDDFKQYINPDSRKEEDVLGDPELRKLKKGDIIQLQRRGYYICDSPYQETSPYTGRPSPCVLFNIPDGHTKEMPTSGSKHKTTSKEEVSVKEAVQDRLGKAAEKSPQEETADPGVLHQRITQQGDRIREMKAAKAGKAEIEPEVKQLLSLKAQYKQATGQDWAPGVAPAVTKAPSTPAAAAMKASSTPAPASGAGNADELNERIKAQGDKVRQIKSAKAPKPEVDAEVKVLLALKAEYKKVTGQDWSPQGHQKATPAKQASSQSQQSGSMNEEAEKLKSKAEEQGNKVRELKGKGADKASIDAEVATLLKLKAEYKALTGQDLVGGAPGAKKEQKKGGGVQKTPAPKQEKKPAPPQQQEKKEAGDGGREVKKVSRLGLEAKKEENLPEWYSQVITKAELVEYYDVSGCYVFRPWSYSIWESISRWFDAKIKEYGFENCYFPLFVSHGALEREKEHIEDFAPEVAWVTRSGQSELAEPIAIRPTSETVMYPSYARWVQSHRDLPIKLNQWCSVVRWEFKHPQPFLRTREFLWQEGHSAYATYEEAEKEVYYIIDLYEEIYENLLAIPVIKGKKTTKERFAGGVYTTTVEAYISASGRGIQAATSHHLGQNFSKMFDISFEDPDTREKCYAYQNSWAITTRSIGIIVMVHGDNKGLVLPPRIASIQAVIIPCGITVNLSDAERKKLYDECDKLVATLKAVGVKAKGDYRDNYSPGWKFNHWELKGVPVRIELGPKDLEKQQFVLVRRDTGAKHSFNLASAGENVKQTLEDMHRDMFNKAKSELDAHLTLCYDFESFCSGLDKQHLLMAPFCGEVDCEDNIKKISARDAVVEEGAPAMGAKGLCIPFQQPKPITDQDNCIAPECKRKPKEYTVFGRSY